jgi:putative spermidine/putrescine transport system permease protein
MLYIIVGIILLLLIFPIVLIVVFSFTDKNFFNWPIESFSPRWWQTFFSDGQWLDCIQRSLIIAFLTVLVSLILGIVAALAMKKLNFKFKKLFSTIVIAPMLLPTIIISISLYYNFAPVKLTDTIIGVVLGHSIVTLPMVFITISNGLSELDENIELAAMSLGSKPLGAFFKLTLPLLTPSILASSAFAFATSLDELVISQYLTGTDTKTLPVYMWEIMRYNVSLAMAVASTILIIGVLTAFSISGVSKIMHIKTK